MVGYLKICVSKQVLKRLRVKDALFSFPDDFSIFDKELSYETHVEPETTGHILPFGLDFGITWEPQLQYIT